MHDIISLSYATSYDKSNSKELDNMFMVYIAKETAKMCETVQGH